LICPQMISDKLPNPVFISKNPRLFKLINFHKKDPEISGSFYLLLIFS